MNVSDRRRATLRRVGDMLSRVVPALERAAVLLVGSEAPRENELARDLMQLAHEGKDLAHESLLASMSEGCVVFLDEEVGIVELERDGITLVLPNETPYEVVDVLFGMADALGVRPSRYTMSGLQAIVIGAILTAERGAELPSEFRKRADACDELAPTRVVTEHARLEGKAAAYRHAAELAEGTT